MPIPKKLLHKVSQRSTEFHRVRFQFKVIGNIKSHDVAMQNYETLNSVILIIGLF